MSSPAAAPAQMAPIAIRKSKVARLPISQLHQLKSRTLDETIRMEGAGQSRRYEEDIIEEALQLYLDIPLDTMQQLVGEARQRGLSTGAYVVQLLTANGAAGKKRR